MPTAPGAEPVPSPACGIVAPPPQTAPSSSSIRCPVVRYFVISPQISYASILLGAKLAVLNDTMRPGNAPLCACPPLLPHIPTRVVGVGFWAAPPG